jgi:hypothetical protein
MANITKLVIERSSSDVQFATVHKAIVRRQGSRSLDTADITIPSKYKVDENDIVRYIQDEVDLRYLVGLYNFQGSCRDEGGFGLDGTSSASYKYPNVAPNEKKYKAHYALDLDAAGKEASVSDNSVLDFSGQFDIYVSFTVAHGGNPTSHFNSGTTDEVLFSKHNGSNGVEIGLKYVSGTWVIYATVNGTTMTGNGSLSSTDTEIGSVTSGAGFEKSRFIRLRRDENNKVVLTLDGLTDGSGCIQTITGSAANTNTMYFGTDRGQTKDFDGLLHQIRIYSGGYLKEGEAYKVITTAPQPITMKFIGKVWKIKDEFDTKKLNCKGLTKFILENRLSANIFSDNITSATTNEPALRNKNIFGADQATTDILKGILHKLDSSFVFNKSFTTASEVLQGRYSAEGGFLSTLDVLATLDRAAFFTLPTKVLMYEKDTGVSTGLQFDHNEFRIIQRGKDEVMVSNDIQVYGRINEQYREQGLGSGSSGGTATLNFTPTKLSIVDNSGNVVTNYKIDKDGREITWTGTVTSPTAKYYYEKVTGTTDDVLYKRVIDSTSITKYGRQSRSMFVPQLSHHNDVDEYADKLLLKSKDVNPRYHVEIPFLFNAVRENHIVTLSNSVMKFPDSNGVLNQTTTEEIVKSITWVFPEGKTIIECGEYPFDGFETSKISGERLSSVSSTTLNTKDAA